MPIRIHNLHSSFTSALDVSSFRVRIPSASTLVPLFRPSFKTIYLANGDRRYELKSAVIPMKPIAYLFMGTLLICVATPFFRRTDLLAYTGWHFIMAFGFLLMMGGVISLKGLGSWFLKQTVSFENGKLILYKSRLFFPVIFEIPLSNIDRISFDEKWFFRDTVFQEAVPSLHIGSHTITFFEWAAPEMAVEIKSLVEEEVQEDSFSWVPAMGQMA